MTRDERVTRLPLQPDQCVLDQVGENSVRLTFLPKVRSTCSRNCSLSPLTTVRKKGLKSQKGKD